MDGAENVESSEGPAMTNSQQCLSKGLESRNLLFGTEILPKTEVTEEFRRGEEEAIAGAVQRALDVNITEVAEVQSTEGDILKANEDFHRAGKEIIVNATEDVQMVEEDVMAAIENVRRAEEDIADAPEDAHGAEENMPDAVEDVQRTEEDIAEAIEDVQGAEGNISDATEDVQGGEEDHHTKMMSHQGLESRNPSLGTETQDKMEVSEEFEGGEEEDIPMTNSEQLKQVHQTYRKMECDRRSYHISTEGTMRQQQALLENMKSENCAFKEMVDTYVIKDYQQQMNNLLEQADKLQSMVEIETRRVKDLDNSITELASKEMDAKRATGGCKAAWEKHKSTQIQIQITENRLEKGMKELSGNKIVKDQHVIASIDYKQWIEMKSLEDIQDVLKIDDVEDILPSFLDACKQDANIYENITHHIQEISELDSMLPENILPIPNVETDSKRSFESQKVQMDKMLEALLESLKYLCIDDVMYFPMIEGLKKQIVLIFKEAGCDVGDKDLELEDHSALESAIRKWFSKLEHFVDQTLS